MSQQRELSIIGEEGGYNADKIALLRLISIILDNKSTALVAKRAL